MFAVKKRVRALDAAVMAVGICEECQCLFRFAVACKHMVWSTS